MFLVMFTPFLVSGFFFPILVGWLFSVISVFITSMSPFMIVFGWSMVGIIAIALVSLIIFWVWLELIGIGIEFDFPD